MSMELTEERMAVTLTQAAADRLLAIMDERGLRQTHSLRVLMGGGGCSGMQYGMAFDNNPVDMDLVSEQYGLRVVIDPKSLPFIDGASIDYEEGPTGGGFRIENPNAISGCGCGQSCSGGESSSGGCGSGCGS